MQASVTSQSVLDCGATAASRLATPLHTLVTGVQRARNRFRDIAADERFAEHVDNPCGLRTFAQLRPTIATHENDRNVGPQLPNLTRKLGPCEVGHRFVGQHKIEALGFRAESLQRGDARIKPHRLVAEFRKRLFRKRNQRTLVVYDHDRLAVAPGHIARGLGWKHWHLARSRQPDRESRAHAYLRRDIDRPAKVSHDAVYERKAEARAIADSLGREERIEHALEDRRLDAATGIAD